MSTAHTEDLSGLSDADLARLLNVVCDTHKARTREGRETASLAEQIACIAIEQQRRAAISDHFRAV